MTSPPASSRQKLPGAKPTKQARSQATLDRISDAVMTLLREKPFDQISVQEIVDASNISTGTFYRRFDNKTALLPLLFERYSVMMGQWFTALSEQDDSDHDLESFVHAVVTETHALYAEHRNFLRAVHLHARFRPDLIDRPSTERHIGTPPTYLSFLTPVADEIKPPIDEAGPFLYFTLTTTMNERMLYPDHGSTRAMAMDEAKFCAHLEAMLLAYLRAG